MSKRVRKAPELFNPANTRPQTLTSSKKRTRAPNALPPTKRVRTNAAALNNFKNMMRTANTLSRLSPLNKKKTQVTALNKFKNFANLVRTANTLSRLSPVNKSTLGNKFTLGKAPSPVGKPRTTRTPRAPAGTTTARKPRTAKTAAVPQTSGNFKNVFNIKKYIVNPNRVIKNTYNSTAWAGVFSLVDTFSAMDYKVFPKKMSVESLVKLHEHFKGKNTWRASDTTSGSFNVTNEDAVNILFTIWLDGVHDKYITQSFVKFIDSDYCKMYFTNKHRELVKDYIKNKPTPYMTKIFNNVSPKIKSFYDGSNSGAPTQWEGKLKENIHEVFNIKPIHLTNETIKIKDGVRRKVYLSVDQEGEQQALSKTVQESFPFEDRTRMIQGYMTIGNILDPGSKMIAAGISREVTRLTTNSPKLQLLYYIGPLNLDFKLPNGESFFKVDLTLRTPPQTNLKKAPTLDYYELRMNGKPVDMGATKAEASKAGLESKAGKFLGDGLQYLTIAFQNSAPFLKGRNERLGKPDNVRAFGTGDAMAFTNYLLFSELMGVKNAPGILEVARTTRTVIECFNLDEYVEPARPLNRYAEPQRSGNTFKNKNNNSNTENNVTSKPSNKNRAFLNYAKTPAGQKFLKAMGFVKL
jgi:hypothetical protein